MSSLFVGDWGFIGFLKEIQKLSRFLQDYLDQNEGLFYYWIWVPFNESYYGCNPIMVPPTHCSILYLIFIQ